VYGGDDRRYPFLMGRIAPTVFRDDRVASLTSERLISMFSRNWHATSRSKLAKPVSKFEGTGGYKTFIIDLRERRGDLIFPEQDWAILTLLWKRVDVTMDQMVTQRRAFIASPNLEQGSLAGIAEAAVGNRQIVVDATGGYGAHRSK
jgi:hypothetical protein